MEARGDRRIVDTEWSLMVAPPVRVGRLDERAVVLVRPDTAVTLQLSRAVFELFRQFYLPRAVQGVLPEGRAREPALACVRHLQERGFLVSPAEGIVRLK